MLARGLLPDFSAGALAELDGIHEPATRAEDRPAICEILSGVP
jgi:hypothetical protein